MTKFSVIIATRKINDFLKESIKNLKQLDYQNFEVLVITDEEEIFDFSGDGRFILLTSGQVGPAEKRNVGAKNATGEVLVFLDDDAYPNKDWLTQANKLFEDKTLYALGGPAMTPPNAGFLEKVSGYIMQTWLASGGTVYRHTPQKEREINDYPTVNLFVRKDAFEEVGGFITDFWPGEDTKLCLDLIKLYGKNFIYSPKPIVYHHRRNVFQPHLKQVSRYGQHRGQFARIFPENSRTIGYFIPSIFVLGLVLGGIATTVVPALGVLYLLSILLYLVLVAIESAKSAVKDKNLKAGLYVALGIFLTHIVYGINFMIGFIRRPRLKLKAVDKLTGNYSEG